MRDVLPTALTAAALSAAPQLDQLPAFDWKTLAWPILSAIVAAGLNWLQRWLTSSAPDVHGDISKDPPT
jgi:hypothetical protein